MKHSCEDDLVTLLQRVSQELKLYCTTKGEKQMNETLLRGVTKKLYFNPGIMNRNGVITGGVGSSQHNYLLKTTQREATLERTGMLGLPTASNFEEAWSELGTELQLGFEQCVV